MSLTMSYYYRCCILFYLLNYPKTLWAFLEKNTFICIHYFLRIVKIRMYTYQNKIYAFINMYYIIYYMLIFENSKKVIFTQKYYNLTLIK